MAEFKSVTLTHRDGRERVATTAAEQVAAEFDGFAVQTSGQKAAATRARNASKATAPKGGKAKAKQADAPTGTATADATEK